jgi:hypothetical protein
MRSAADECYGIFGIKIEGENLTNPNKGRPLYMQLLVMGNFVLRVAAFGHGQFCIERCNKKKCSIGYTSLTDHIK